jgi:hypothetical protein
MIHDEAGALRAIARAFWSVCGGCVAATACWMVWGLATPGDYFASGSPWLWFSLLASGATGGYAAFKARSKRFRVALLLLGLACAIFWLAVRNGWWVKSPPSAAGPVLRTEREHPDQSLPRGPTRRTQAQPIRRVVAS